jgi:hypothetical protein
MSAAFPSGFVGTAALAVPTPKPGRGRHLFFLKDHRRSRRQASSSRDRLAPPFRQHEPDFRQAERGPALRRISRLRARLSNLIRIKTGIAPRGLMKRSAPRRKRREMRRKEATP